MSEPKDVCCAGDVKTLILVCSGGSNVGQISNRMMVEMDRKDLGNAYCLAGVGAELSGFVESARAASTILIDGCPVGCGKKVFAEHGLEPARYIVVTGLGIEKNHNFDHIEKDTEKALAGIL